MSISCIFLCVSLAYTKCTAESVVQALCVFVFLSVEPKKESVLTSQCLLVFPLRSFGCSLHWVPSKDHVNSNSNCNEVVNAV